LYAGIFPQAGIKTETDESKTPDKNNKRYKLLRNYYFYGFGDIVVKAD
jgi:hypothetical protein